MNPFSSLRSILSRYRKRSKLPLDGRIPGIEYSRYRRGNNPTAHGYPYGTPAASPNDDYFGQLARDYEPHPGFAEFHQPDYDSYHGQTPRTATPPYHRAEFTVHVGHLPLPEYDDSCAAADEIERAIDQLKRTAQSDEIERAIDQVRTTVSPDEAYWAGVKEFFRELPFLESVSEGLRAAAESGHLPSPLEQMVEHVESSEMASGPDASAHETALDAQLADADPWLSPHDASAEIDADAPQWFAQGTAAGEAEAYAEEYALDAMVDALVPEASATEPHEPASLAQSIDDLVDRTAAQEYGLGDHPHDPLAIDPVAQAHAAFDQQMQAFDQMTVPDLEPPQPDPFEMKQQLYNDQMQQLLNPFGMPGPMG